MSKTKTPIALCINDWHIGKETIADSIENWEEAIDFANKYRVHSLLIGGDVFLSRVSQSLPVLRAVQDSLRNAVASGLQVIAAPGNHDKVSLEETYSYCHVFEDITGYSVVNEHKVVYFNDVAIHMMSYFPETGSFKKRLESIELIEDKKNILYCHQGINGALGHSDETNNKELPTHIFERFDTVLVAHYHNRVHLKGTNIYYVGSSRQHNHGEDTEKGYTLIYSDGSHEYLQNNVNTKYITFEERYEDIDKSTFASITEAKEENYRVRVRILCKSNQKKLINKRDFMNAGASKVEVVEDKIDGEEATQVSASVRYNKNGIKTSYEAFYEESGGEDPDFGLKYLDQINM